MKIRTQFIIIMALFGVTLSIIAASIISTSQQVMHLDRQEGIARNIEREANELGYLANDYLYYHESQQWSRWMAKFASFTADLASLRTDSPEEQAIINNIKGNQQRLRAVFSSAAATIEDVTKTKDAAGLLALAQVSWSRMAVQNQEMFFNIIHLSQVIRDQKDRLTQRNIWLVLSLLALFGAYFISIFAIVYRRIFSSLAELQAGAKIIGTGNLDFAFAAKRHDEIGDLSRAFNLMTASLKDVTASKAELEREIAERRIIEASLQERTDQLEASNKDLESFTYSVSHDLRAPLRAIRSFARILLSSCRTKLSEEDIGRLNTIQKNVVNMGQLIDDLLSLSRLGRLPVEATAIDMGSLAQAVYDDMQASFDGRSIKFDILSPPPAALGDKVLIRQVMINLLANAMKFTQPRAEGAIEFGGRREGSECVYYVKDNGVGFDMRYADKLFGVFQRLHAKDEFEGTGVGLAIVQRSVLKHGGRVWAEGKEGEGAIFYFSLPAPNKRDK